MISAIEKTVPAVSRFSNRAENYLQFRPAYPSEILPFLVDAIDLGQEDQVTDIGCGTGLFAELFLKSGYAVTGVEPNAAMRSAAEKKLNRYRRFTLNAGTAEHTGIDTGTTNLVTVAQAFHWIDIDMAREEFRRILRCGGHVAIVSTHRRKETPFLAGYEYLKQTFRLEPLPLITDAMRVSRFFEKRQPSSHSFLHKHWLDFDGLKGLLLSSPDIPLPGHQSYDTMISSLIQLFVQYNQNGFVEIEQETHLYYGQL